MGAGLEERVRENEACGGAEGGGSQKDRVRWAEGDSPVLCNDNFNF